jgi:two-component system chemotaxis response regulator CheB
MTQRRDVVLIGASVGGVEALSRLFSELPASFPAAVLAVIHTRSSPLSRLDLVLARHASLPVRFAVDHEPIQPGHVYIAPADVHLLVRGGHVSLQRGPRENGHRPAVDPLFRSAARFFGARTIGVVLTGGRDCGAAGLEVVRACGGATVVQEPDDAACPEMPASAIRRGRPDHVVPLTHLPALLSSLTSQTVEQAAPPPSPAEQQGAPTSLMSCPSCLGTLQEVSEGASVRFECHVGHVFSRGGLLAEQAEQLEAALWAGVRALEESSSIAGRSALRAQPAIADRLEEKSRAMAQHADTLRQILLHGSLLSAPDGDGII